MTNAEWRWVLAHLPHGALVLEVVGLAIVAFLAAGA